ncbi:MAG TPA: hypothetical protein VKP88_07690 [Candidatus Paceibacterota bacterium]|nr:hypothetical protein [Candidatus Paceibacterota bacterium]
MSTAKKYTKRPIEITAMRVEKPYKRVAEWCGGTIITEDGRAFHCILIETLEGKMEARVGDYVIRGIEGEFYPCRPDIFERTYVLKGKSE